MKVQNDTIVNLELWKDSKQSIHKYIFCWVDACSENLLTFSVLFQIIFELSQVTDFVLSHIYLVLGHCTCILLLSFDRGTCNSSSCISSSLAVWYEHIQVQSTVVYQNTYICTYTVRHDFLCHAHSIA